MDIRSDFSKKLGAHNSGTSVNEKTTMKRLVVFLCLFLVGSMTAACAKSADSAGDKSTMIEPGDKIGNFLIATGVQGNFTYGFNVECSEPGADNTYSCKATMGQVINVSTGLVDDTKTGKLDEVWSHSNYQMFINDRPVDLQAFGTIDYTHPQVGVIRFANVVITTNQPGEITVRDSGYMITGTPLPPAPLTCSARRRLTRYIC
jgi:hypothetical protein